MSALSDNPRVADLLVRLWDAPEREAGLAVAELPEELCDEALLSACEGAQLIQFASRNHCWAGGKLIVESDWSVAELFKPNRKQAWQVLNEAVSEDVPEGIRLRVQLTYRGSIQASQLALERSQHDQSDTPTHVTLAAPKAKRRGRRKADYETVQCEAKLAADWERARESSVYKPEFAKQINMTVKQLDALLDRVAVRKRRSDK